MKKVKIFIKNNIKTVIAFILGMIISGTGVYAATILFASNEVSYDNTSSGMTATNVQDALDELYTKANSIVPIDFDTFQTNTAKTVYASKLGVCIDINNKLNCFKAGNWDIEKNHIKEVFSDNNCGSDSESILCQAYDFTCYVYDDGAVYCAGPPDDSYCYVEANGYIDCT